MFAEFCAYIEKKEREVHSHAPARTSTHTHTHNTRTTHMAFPLSLKSNKAFARGPPHPQANTELGALLGLGDDELEE